MSLRAGCTKMPCCMDLHELGPKMQKAWAIVGLGCIYERLSDSLIGGTSLHSRISGEPLLELISEFRRSIRMCCKCAHRWVWRPLIIQNWTTNSNCDRGSIPGITTTWLCLCKEKVYFIKLNINLKLHKNLFCKISRIFFSETLTIRRSDPASSWSLPRNWYRSEADIVVFEKKLLNWISPPWHYYKSF